MCDFFLDHIFFHPLRLPYAVSVCFINRVHLRPNRHHFLDSCASALVFHLAQHLFVRGGVKWVVFGVVACVIHPQVFFHVFVGVFRLDVQEQAVCVCVDQLALRPISCFQTVVEEVVHQYLAVLEDRHACVHGLV